MKWMYTYRLNDLIWLVWWRRKRRIQRFVTLLRSGRDIKNAIGRWREGQLGRTVTWSDTVPWITLLSSIWNLIGWYWSGVRSICCRWCCWARWGRTGWWLWILSWSGMNIRALGSGYNRWIVFNMDKYGFSSYLKNIFPKMIQFLFP